MRVFWSHRSPVTSLIGWLAGRGQGQGQGYALQRIGSRIVGLGLHMETSEGMLVGNQTKNKPKNKTSERKTHLWGPLRMGVALDGGNERTLRILVRERKLGGGEQRGHPHHHHPLAPPPFPSGASSPWQLWVSASERATQFALFQTKRHSTFARSNNRTRGKNENKQGKQKTTHPEVLESEALSPLLRDLFQKPSQSQIPEQPLDFEFGQGFSSSLGCQG